VSDATYVCEALQCRASHSEAATAVSENLLAKPKPWRRLV